MKVTKPKVKREKSTDSTRYYVNNAVLLPAVLEAKALGKVTTKLITMIQMIAERYSRRSNFVNYSFREDMVALAVMSLCDNALKFNPERSSNPFSFYTTAIHNSFLHFMAAEKKQRNIRDVLLIDAGSNPSFNFMQGEKDESDYEIKESDEVQRVSRENDPDDLYANAPEVINVLAPGDQVPVTPREERVQYAGRAPGKVTKYGPDDFEINEKGELVMKVKPVVEEVKPKKTRAKKVTK